MLIEHDFLKYADSLKMDSLKMNIRDSFIIYDENTNKFAIIDAEELTEYNFDFFLPEVNKMLKKRDLELVVEPAKDYQTSNDLFINGEKINLYSQEE